MCHLAASECIVGKREIELGISRTAQGSSLSPLTKKGSISLYSRIFTVAFLGGSPCAIARNACSDCATIARARSFLWIEWYLDGMAQSRSVMTAPRYPGVLVLPRMTPGR